MEFKPQMKRIFFTDWNGLFSFCERRRLPLIPQIAQMGIPVFCQISHICGPPVRNS